jgi:hypothetical protein
MRNYKRYIGVLLDTHWTLDEIEIGTFDKVYDTTDGAYYYERKIVKTRVGGLIDFQIIAERTPAEEGAQPPSQEEVPIPDIESEETKQQEQ